MESRLGGYLMPSQHKILIHSLLNFQVFLKKVLKTLPEPQFSILNPQSFGTY